MSRQFRHFRRRSRRRTIAICASFYRLSSAVNLTSLLLDVCLLGYAFVKISRLLNMQIMESTESHGLQEGASVKSSMGNRSRS
jgi:hypothetical protein